MKSNKVLKDSGDFKQRDNFIKQQQQLKAMKPTGNSKGLSADSMIEDLLSKKETFQKKIENFSGVKPLPAWLTADNANVHPMYYKIWEMVKCPPSIGQQTPELADTALVSSLLMTSGLSTDMLGFIWSLTNATVPGALIQPELYSVLALVALAQSGYIFNNLAVLNSLPQPPLPNLNVTVLAQLKSGFNVTSPVVQTPTGVIGNNVNEVKTTSSGVNLINASGYNYFTDFQSAPEPKKHTDNTIMPLDVNNLQGAPSLTLPSSFVYNSVNSTGEQEFAAFQSAEPTVQSTSPLTGVTPMHNFQSGKQSAVNTAIPSISLGISKPQAPQNLLPTSSNIMQHKSSAIPDLHQQSAQHSSNVSANSSFTTNKQIDIDHFQVSFASPSSDIGSKLSKIKLGENKMNVQEIGEATTNVNSTNKDHTSSDVDDSFDSLCTERAFSSTSKQTNPPDEEQNATVKPNYNINLFDTYSDVKSIFPVSSSGVALSDVDDIENAHVMHNPLFSNDDNRLRSLPYIESTNEMKGNQIEDDDFTDFQSADFTSINNKMDEFPTDFQQAPVVVPPMTSLHDSKISISNNISVSDGALNSSISSSENNDDDLFPSLNLQFDSVVGSKVAEPSDSLSVKSIDISIISSGRDTRANSSPVSSDYECQENKKEQVAKENGDFGFDSYKEDKTFLSLSSSIVFDNNNTSVVLENDGVTQPTKLINTHQSTLGSSPFINTSQVSDKYSALRMLEASSYDSQPQNEVIVSDDFGDFITAGASDSQQLELPDVYTTLPETSLDKSSEVKCLEACVNILEKSYNILKGIASPTVLSEILTDPRGTMHISCLLEVYRVSERLMQHADCKSTPLANRVQSVWNMMVQMVPDDVTSYHKQLEENLGPKCGVCKCNYGPTPVRYGLNYYHPPCANLYLRYVSPLLPSVPI